VRKEGVVLWQVTHATPAGLQASYFTIAYPDVTRIESVESTQTLQEKRLPRTRGSQEDEVLSALYVKRKVAQGERTDGVVDVVDYDHRCPNPTKRMETSATVAKSSITRATASATSILPTDCSRYTVVGSTSVRSRTAPTNTIKGPKMPKARVQIRIPATAMPRLASGKATRKNAPAGLDPRVSATCSSLGSIPSNASFIARIPKDAETNT
jgi:hypothetical protein